MTENVQGVNSVDIAVAILNYIASQRGRARASAIASGCGLSKSRLHKYLVSLSRTGMLNQDENGQYCLGETLIKLADAVPGNQDVITLVNPVLCDFRDRMNYSTGVAVPTPEGLVLRHYHRSFKNVDIDFLDNTPVPLDASAAGLIFMSYGVYPSPSPEERAQIERVRQQGYAVRYKPTHGIPGAQSIACPICDSQGNLVAIGVTMGFFDNDDEIGRVAQELKSALSQLRL